MLNEYWAYLMELDTNVSFKHVADYCKKKYNAKIWEIPMGKYGKALSKLHTDNSKVNKFVNVNLGHKLTICR